MENNSENKRLTLSLNVSAPLFNLKDIFGRQINLKEYEGKKVFIAFFRHAGCPFCNLRVHFLQKKHEELKARNMEMIFFFESSEKVLSASTFHQEISPIPLIGDPEKVWYATYGIEQSTGKSTLSHLTGFIQTAIKAKMNSLPLHMMAEKESFSTMPAEFLLDEKLIIRHIHYSKGLNDRMSISHIMEFADSGKVTTDTQA